MSTSTTLKYKKNLKKNGNFNMAEKMYRKKGFIHHFIGEGLDEGEFIILLFLMYSAKSFY